jgi:hypothetical protein
MGGNRSGAAEEMEKKNSQVNLLQRNSIQHALFTYEYLKRETDRCFSALSANFLLTYAVTCEISADTVKIMNENYVTSSDSSD